ncbi:hypothetical protein AgCh_037295 [Apium graveolens]
MKPLLRRGASCVGKTLYVQIKACVHVEKDTKETKEILICRMDVKISMSVHSNQEAPSKETDASILVPMHQETTFARAKMGGSLLTIFIAWKRLIAG